MQQQVPIRRRLRLMIVTAVAAMIIAPLTPIPASAAAAVLIDDEVLAAGSTWSYLDTGIDPGPTWNEPGFDDGPWATGNGQFGYGDGDETTVVDYGPDPDNKHATTYFRTTVTLTDVHQIVGATATLTYDDGAAVYVNGTEVHATSNLPAGFGHHTWANASGDETMVVALDHTTLVDGDNTIAVEIHQTWRKSSDISFDLGLTVTRDDLPLPPTVQADGAETDQAVAVSGDVSVNDDPGLIYNTDTIVDVTIGTLVFNADGSWNLTPAADYLGTVVVPHSGCDGAGVCATTELTIVVDVVGDLNTEQLVAMGSTWSYLDDGTNPGPTWDEPGFADGAWNTGNGQFGYGDGDETTVVDYGPDPDNKYATTYFRTTISTADAYQFTDLAATLTYDDAAAIYLNGIEVHRSPALAADAGSGTWATANAEETISFPLDPLLLVDGDNTVAVEIHQAWRKSNDISFDLALTATRHVLPGPPAPTVIDDLAVTPPGVAVSGDVAGNDRANDANIPVWAVDPTDLPDPATTGTLTFADDGTFSFGPTAGFQGTVTVPYSACNGGSCSSAELTVVVIDGPPAEPGLAQLANPGNQAVPVGLAATIPLDITPDVDGVDTVLTVQGLPDGLTVQVDPGTGEATIVGTPTEAGTHPVAVYVVVDQDQSWATASFDLVVDDSALVSRSLGLPDAIHLVDPADQILTVGDATTDIGIDFQVTDGTFVYQWLPPGLNGTFDGHLVGTPTEAGAWTTEITLIDLDGNQAETSLVITVTDGPPTGDPAEHPGVDVPGLDIRPETGQHGVLGFNVMDSTVADVRVWDMEQIGDHMYVGGEFQQVQEGEDGVIIDQAFLARFHIDSGHYDPTFTPVLDGNVHALETAPRGVLLVGGEFTNIDGVANTSALAAIDPVTGQVDTTFRASVERPWSSNDPIVRELEVVGELLYLVGNFSHLRDRDSGKRERFYKAARVGADLGELDLTWLPEVTGGSVYGMGVDQDRGRVLLTGSFSAVGAEPDTGKVAIVDTVLGSVEAHTMPATAWAVFDIEYANDMIFLANGWNNQITVHDANDFSLLHQYQSDGDFQFIEKVGDYLFAGCHCTQDPQYPTARVLDAQTGLEVDIAFNLGGNIDGAWAVATDDRGCAWIGGDIWDGGFDIGTVWARGFARFCADD